MRRVATNLGLSYSTCSVINRYRKASELQRRYERHQTDEAKLPFYSIRKVARITTTDGHRHVLARFFI